MNKAIEKINKEIEANKDNRAIKKVGEFILEQMSEVNAEKILVEGKTIKGSFEAMKTHAKTMAKNGYAVLTDEEGYEQVMKYYEMSKKEETSGLEISLTDIL